LYGLVAGFRVGLKIFALQQILLHITFALLLRFDKRVEVVFPVDIFGSDLEREYLACC
jgi:hypothetical protein